MIARMGFRLRCLRVRIGVIWMGTVEVVGTEIWRFGFFEFPLPFEPFVGRCEEPFEKGGWRGRSDRWSAIRFRCF